ncbi:MAG: TetR/AcrR family transcriptional regulator [Propionicimonas sp.]
MGRITEEDPRYLRVRASLTRAILELAADMPPEEIPVSQLTAAAGVSRTTFYSHASSPAELLAGTLEAELRPDLDILAERMGESGADYLALWREIYLVLLGHVEQHRGIYETLLATHSFAMYSLLGYLEEVAGRYVDAVSEHFTDGGVTALWRTMAIQQQVHNTIAMITAWLQTQLADPPEAVLETYLTLAPPWQLARPDASGHISLRRGVRRTSATPRLPVVDAEPVDNG